MRALWGMETVPGQPAAFIECSMNCTRLLLSALLFMAWQRLRSARKAASGEAEDGEATEEMGEPGRGWDVAPAEPLALREVAVMAGEARCRNAEGADGALSLMDGIAAEDVGRRCCVQRTRESHDVSQLTGSFSSHRLSHRRTDELSRRCGSVGHLSSDGWGSMNRQPERAESGDSRRHDSPYSTCRTSIHSFTGSPLQE